MCCDILFILFVYTCDLILARIWLLGLCPFINRVLHSPRSVGLVLVHLGSSLLCHVDHKFHIVPQVCLGLGSLVCRCKWTQNDLVQAFRSQLVILVWETLGLTWSCVQDCRYKVSWRHSTGGRPAGLGILPFWLIFVYVVPEFNYSSKLVELVNVNKNYSIMVLKVWNRKESWQ